MTAMPSTPISPLAGLNVRRLPARQFEPPYDQQGPRAAVAPVANPETPAGPRSWAGPASGPPALPFPLPSGVAAAPEAPRLLRLVPPLPADRPAQGPPDPTGWAGRLVQAVVEVIGGDRPAAQLVRWTTAPVYADLQQRGRVQASGSRPARLGLTPRTTRSVVRSVRVHEPRPGVAEVCAVVWRGGRARAIALRLEATGTRWLCTALTVG